MSLTAIRPNFSPATLRPHRGQELATGDAQKSGSAFTSALQAAAGQSPKALRNAAEQLVSTAFVLPILSSMHDSPFAQKGPFAPGTAEKRFAPLLDERLADTITRKSDFGLVQSIVNKFTPKTPAASPNL